MAVGEIIRCCTLEEVFRKAFELNREGIKTEFVSANTLRVVGFV
ncbi:hypothetical protein SAMN02910298_01523 [Pseudobutyrivibrio sp. YE44]|nr:hypothetical protein [Pseudobutyrivibrio sp. YE44]SDB30835.1 hypothetical protein SAMN02910298_01523 [Pseudobutyrivibrio sp. YE44]